MHGGRILSNASYGAVGIDAAIGCSGAGAVIVGTLREEREVLDGIPIQPSTPVPDLRLACYGDG